MPAASAFTWSAVSGPPLLCAKAGIGVPGRPSEIRPQHDRVRHDRQEERVVQRRRRAELAVGPVAAGAVLPVQGREVDDAIGRHGPVRGLRIALDREAAQPPGPRAEARMPAGRAAAIVPARVVEFHVRSWLTSRRSGDELFQAVRSATRGRDVDLLRADPRRSPPPAEHELRDDEPGPVDPFLEHRVDDPHEPEAHRRPEQRHQQAAPGQAAWGSAAAAARAGRRRARSRATWRRG